MHLVALLIASIGLTANSNDTEKAIELESKILKSRRAISTYQLSLNVFDGDTDVPAKFVMLSDGKRFRLIETRSSSDSKSLIFKHLFDGKKVYSISPDEWSVADKIQISNERPNYPYPERLGIVPVRFLSLSAFTLEDSLCRTDRKIVSVEDLQINGTDCVCIKSEVANGYRSTLCLSPMQDFSVIHFETSNAEEGFVQRIDVENVLISGAYFPKVIHYQQKSKLRTEKQKIVVTNAVLNQAIPDSEFTLSALQPPTGHSFTESGKHLVWNGKGLVLDPLFKDINDDVAKGQSRNRFWYYLLISGSVVSFLVGVILVGRWCSNKR